MKYRCIFLDLDGVLWRGDRIIEENLRKVREWEGGGKRLIYITNNSTRLRGYYLRRLKELGLNPSLEDILTSAYATALFLRKMEVKTVFVVGEAGLRGEIESTGIELIDNMDALIEGNIVPQAVAVGMDRGFNYKKIWTAMRAIKNGAIFVASNRDRVFPLSDGEAPGGGVMVRAIEEAAGKKADYTVGKPESPIMELALEICGSSKNEILMVGDRLDTDIEAARRFGIDSLLVLTGVTKREDKVHLATYTVENLSCFKLD